MFLDVIRPQLTSLDKLASEFASRNELGSIRLKPFKINGLIGYVVKFESGTLLLKEEQYWGFLNRPLFHRNEKGDIVEGAITRYFATGLIDDEAVDLSATLEISRPTERIPGKKIPVVFAKGINPIRVHKALAQAYKGYGGYEKSIKRQDYSPLWFVSEANLRG